MEEDQNNLEPQEVTTNTNTNAPKNGRKGFNITSMILGIIAILCTCVWYINIPCSIIAIIFSVAGRNDEGRGMGIAGMVLGIVAIVLYVVLVVLAILGISTLAGLAALNEINISTY